MPQGSDPFLPAHCLLLDHFPSRLLNFGVGWAPNPTLFPRRSSFINRCENISSLTEDTFITPEWSSSVEACRHAWRWRWRTRFGLSQRLLTGSFIQMHGNLKQSTADLHGYSMKTCSSVSYLIFSSKHLKIAQSRLICMFGCSGSFSVSRVITWELRLDDLQVQKHEKTSEVNTRVSPYSDRVFRCILYPSQGHVPPLWSTDLHFGPRVQQSAAPGVTGASTYPDNSDKMTASSQGFRSLFFL